jgi:hypothetical protein
MGESPTTDEHAEAPVHFPPGYPESERCIALLARALQQFLRAEPHPISGDTGLNVFPKCSPRIAELGKAARIVSGLHAVFVLVGARKTTEAMAMLRLINDYADEIKFLFRGQADKEWTAVYWQFLADYFRDTPRSLEEQSRRRSEPGARGYVARRDINKSNRELLAGIAEIDLAAYEDQRALLASAKNGYVHGGYGESMEMWDPITDCYEVFGMPEHHARVAGNFAVLNLVPCIVAFELMAKERRLDELAQELESQRDALMASAEYDE